MSNDPYGPATSPAWGAGPGSITACSASSWSPSPPPGRRSACCAAPRRGLALLTAGEVVVDADGPEIPVGVDGEAIVLPTPVRCTALPKALRVRVPRNRPGVPAPRPVMDWVRLRHLAAGRG